MNIKVMSISGIDPFKITEKQSVFREFVKFFCGKTPETQYQPLFLLPPFMIEQQYFILKNQS